MGNVVLRYYNGNLTKALMDVYPELGRAVNPHYSPSKIFSFSPSFFLFLHLILCSPTHNILSQEFYWRTKTIRDWFDAFARDKEFDPLVAANWYSVSHADIKSAKVLISFRWDSLSYKSQYLPLFSLSPRITDFS
jgi:hypothetical protein